MAVWGWSDIKNEAGTIEDRIRDNDELVYLSDDRVSMPAVMAMALVAILTVLAVFYSGN